MTSIEEQAVALDKKEKDEKDKDKALKDRPVTLPLEPDEIEKEEANEKDKLIDNKPVVLNLSPSSPTTESLTAVVEAAKAIAKEKYAKLIWVSFEFCSVGDVDTVNEKYQAEVKIRASWYDDDVIEEYDKKKHWYPKLFIENALDNVKEEIAYKVAKVNDKCIITETRIAKGYFWERMELQNFPLDIQELSVTLASRLSPSKIRLIQDPNRLSNLHGEATHTFRDQQKWKLYKICQVSKKASYDLSKEENEAREALVASSPINPSPEMIQLSFTKSTNRPKLSATCYCSRKPDYYLYNCFAFNFLITSLSLTIFLIDVKLAPNRITGTFTLILTSVSFRWTTSKILPTLAYLTSLDKYQMICILYLIMCCVWHSSFAVMNLDIEHKERINQYGLAAFASVLIIIQIFFLIGLYSGWAKIKKKKREEKLFVELMNKRGADQQFSDDED